MKVDLHIHTTASDGCWGPVELVDEIKKAGIGLFAVTDHDTITNVVETERLSRIADINFVRGVEVTSKYNNKPCHILGYGIDVNNTALLDLCRNNTQRMQEFNYQEIKSLISKGMPINYDEFLTYKYDRRRGGGALTNFLLDKGFFGTFEESLAFAAKNINWTAPDYPPPSDVVAAIKDAGGHPILAHPGSTLLGTGLLDEELKTLVKTGIEGLECYSTYHNEELTQRFIRFCQEMNLLITAGSDCHGPLLKARSLGKQEVDISNLNLTNIWQAKISQGVMGQQ